jgi:serine/threonine protein kinase
MQFTLKDLDLSTTVGTGTFGRVRLVKHRATGKFYALKILKKSEIIRLKQVDHIKSEVRILSKIFHPFVVNLLGHTQDEKRLYMLMEYVPGGEVFTHLRSQGRFSNDASKFYTAQIALAFAHCHENQVAYRDLKPENLLLSKTGNIKITDFGFAKVVEDRTWTLCGTPEYLAPEIIQSKGHNTSVDWWALGILIYEMLAGYPPFYDENPFGIYQKILAGRVDYPKYFDVKAKDLIRRLLTADRTKRLGCLRNGAEDVKAHKWFARVDWDAVYGCSIRPPFAPRVKGESDTSNFDDYPDSDEDSARPLNSRERALFAEFDSM